MADQHPSSVAGAIRAAMLTCNPREKVRAARSVAREWRLGRLKFGFEEPMPDRPGRPPRPELLAPRMMPRRRKAQSQRGLIALFHSIAHIEFVAIDLALDMAGRFGAQMGAEFVGDFLAVAADEAMHFALLDRHLRTLGSHYGALPAHDGLWEAAFDTRHDVAARLAVVPMLLEARGLDVTPMIIEKVESAGDERGSAILNRILDDEIRHVRIGANHFFNLCGAQGTNPDFIWKSLVIRHFRGSVKPPFNDSARQSAGLSRSLYTEVA